MVIPPAFILSLIVICSWMLTFLKYQHVSIPPYTIRICMLTGLQSGKCSFSSLTDLSFQLFWRDRSIARRTTIILRLHGYSLNTYPPSSSSPAGKTPPMRYHTLEVFRIIVLVTDIFVVAYDHRQIASFSDLPRISHAWRMRAIIYVTAACWLFVS